MSDGKPDLEAAYALETPDDNLRLYANWARSYDADFAADMAYVLPLQVARAYADAGGIGPVIDVGAGTGLCAQALAGLGVGPIDGTDLSPDMLKVAATKGVYQKLFEGNLLDRLPCPDAAYCGAVSSGTFTSGHVGPEALKEVLRVVQPGGWVALSVNRAHFVQRGFAAAIVALGDQVAHVGQRDVRIYGDAAKGPHAGDHARIVTCQKR